MHGHSRLNARLDKKRLRIEVTLTNLAENRIKWGNDRGNHDAVHTRNFQAGHGEQVAEQDPVLVYCAGLHRSYAPVGEELMVARRIVRTFVRSRTTCVRFCSGKNSEHRVGVADIENEKHTSQFVVSEFRSSIAIRVASPYRSILYAKALLRVFEGNHAHRALRS